MITDIHNGVPVHDGNTVYISDYCEAFGFKQRDELVDEMASDGANADEIDEAWDAIIEAFYAWCDENDYQGEEV